MRLFSVNVLLLILIFATPAILFAQQSETLVTSEVTHGGFGSLVFGVTSVNGEASYLRGTRGAWSLNFEDGHTLNIGLGRYRTQTGFSAVNWQQNGTDVPELRTNYSGFELEYLNRSHKLIHYGVQGLIGGGTVRFRDSD